MAANGEGAGAGDDDVEAQLAAFEADVAALDVDIEGDDEARKEEEASSAGTQLQGRGRAETQEDANAQMPAASASSSTLTSTTASAVAAGPALTEGNAPAATETSSVAAMAQPTLNKEYIAALESRASQQQQRRMGSYSAEDEAGDAATSRETPKQPGEEETKPSESGSRGQKRALRVGATGRFEDKTLDQWPENDHRLWVGQLGNDVNDKLLASKFHDYRSFNMARVIRNRKTFESKGYGIVSFGDPMEMVRAMREQQAKYCGSRRMQIRRSRAEERDLSTVQKKNKKRKQAMRRFGAM